MEFWPVGHNGGMSSESQRRVRILAIEHERGTGPERFGEWLVEAGAEVVVTRPYLGEVIPALGSEDNGSFDALIVLLVVLALDKVFGLSGTKLFSWFFWLYNVGVILTAGMMVWHGSLTVLGQQSNAMIAGIAGLGHIALSVSFVLFFLALRKKVVTASENSTGWATMVP